MHKNKQRDIEEERIEPYFYSSATTRTSFVQILEKSCLLRYYAQMKKDKISFNSSAITIYRAKYGASLYPQEVEWVGPDQVHCPHCDAILAVETERI
jgi:hypothetical protein